MPVDIEWEDAGLIPVEMDGILHSMLILLKTDFFLFVGICVRVKDN